MAKLIPGKIRTEGIHLYETGKVQIIKEKNTRLFARVDEEEIRYSLDDDLVFCGCDFFQKRGYCVHLAALEHYLKNDDKGRKIYINLETGQEKQEEVETQVSFGKQFLDMIQTPDLPKIYQISVDGQVEAGTNRIIWTLRIGTSPFEKYYVIRDIPLFLKVIENHKGYLIGKTYETAIELSQFDNSSQNLLVFLQGLTEDQSDTSLFFKNQGRHLYFPLTFFEQGVNLLMELDDFQFEHQITAYHHVLFQDFDGDAGFISFNILEDTNYYEMDITEEKRSNSFYRGQVLFHKGTFYLLSKEQASLFDKIIRLPMNNQGRKVLQFDKSDRDLFAAQLVQLRKIGKVVAPESLQIRTFQPFFYFDREEDGSIRLDMIFDYQSCLVTSRKELETLPFASDIQFAQKIFQLALSSGFEAEFQSWRQGLKSEAIYTFFHKVIPDFQSLGEVSISEKLQELYQVQKPQIQVSSQGNLLDIHFDFQEISKEDIDLAMKALANRQDFYINSSNEVFFFDEETKKVRQEIEDLGIDEIGDGSFRARKSLAYTISQLFKNQEHISLSDEFRGLARDLKHPEEFPIQKMNIKAQLRDYQKKGVQWLQMLHHYGFGGILADDMGLGKTLQSIAFISSQIKKDSRILILAPSGLIYNWADEFKKFAPDLDLVVVHGLKPNRESLLAEKHQIYVTSYATFRQDSDIYKQMSFDFLFLDEAQVMKNAQTKIAKTLRQFVVPSIIALSGTPIENHLGELWSIFQIVLPGLLPAKNDFMKLSAEQVSQFIKPFVMRRKKEEVLSELPDLIEVVYKNELEDQQKAIYLAQLQQMKERLVQVTETEFQKNRVDILTGIMRLRQICDTPALFMDDYEGASGKLDSLRDLLIQISESGHRVLIFSQFRGMLDLIEKELPGLGLSSFKITGSTPSKERQEMTKEFNQGEKDVFLISLKAGGVGLNLTGADTVILVDLWWNPAVESQAIGRAHRMGQEKIVEVYRLVTRGTIEEKIQELQEEKKNLVSEVLDGTESRASLTLDEIREILGIS